MIADISISLAPVAILIGLISIYLKFYSKKPHIFLNDNDNIVIHNITTGNILVLYICTKDGIIRDSSCLSVICGDENSIIGFPFISLNLPIKQGESEDLAFTLNNTYNYNLKIKRNRIFRPHIYHIELYSKNIIYIIRRYIIKLIISQIILMLSFIILLFICVDKIF